jgi:integrase
MKSTSTPRKAGKGTVKIKVSNDRLQLVFSVAGQRCYLSLGVPDTAINRRLAESKAAQIELDILSGHFDATLEKYQPESARRAAPAIKPPPILTPEKLWARYTEYKASQLKETTRLYHVSFERLFVQLGEVPMVCDRPEVIGNALEIKAGLEKITTIYQTKRALIQLSAACKWGLKHGIVAANPFDGMANELPKFRYQLDPKPNAFTEAEREQILHSFRTDARPGTTYQHYSTFVEFLFLTGCRPSEAIGLQWKHIAADFQIVRFEGSVTTSGNGRPIRVEGSKNNKKRSFPCSARLQTVLRSLKPDSSAPNDLVFPAPKGKVIFYNNFCTNAWTKVVDPIKPDTTPYSCRDTFITLQIMKGTPVTAVAQWCDTSVEMIQKHYADHLKLLTLKPID